MPQLMPLYWVSYMMIFMVVIYMMISFYSIIFVKKLCLINDSVKYQKNLWFW